MAYIPGPDVESDVRPEKVRDLDPVFRRNLRSMIGDKCLGVQPYLGAPWNITDSPKREKSDDPCARYAICEPAGKPGFFGQCWVRPLLPSDKTRRGAVSEVMNFKVTMSQQDVEDKALRQALESGQ